MDSSISTLEAIDHHLIHEGNHTTARFRDLVLDSAYQPIFSPNHGRMVGFEALLRATNNKGKPIAPPAIFRSCLRSEEVVLLDRLCRALHVNNFPWQGVDKAWLFMNINPEVVIHGDRYGSFFSDLLSTANITHSRVVVEIMEGTTDYEKQLADAVHYYRELGCLVAIDDFGAGHSNFERIWKISPDIVKLDRSMIVRAEQDHKVRRIFPRLVELLHEAGCLVVAEGVETEDQVMIALDADTDFVQGWYFGMPVAVPEKPHVDLNPVCNKLKQLNTQEEKTQEKVLAEYIQAIESAVDLLQQEHTLGNSTHNLLPLPHVERCYLLDAEGIQLGHSVIAADKEHYTNPLFEPVASAEGANWSRRPYFRRAVRQPMQVQVTRPYLSMPGANMCVTLSMAFTHRGHLHVFCCDIAWDP